MTVVAQLAIEAGQSEFDQVLAELPDEELIAIAETDSSATGQRIVEVQLSNGELLSRLHKGCVERDILCDVQRISHEPTGTTDRQRPSSSDERGGVEG
jgi:hypothetical protein